MSEQEFSPVLLVHGGAWAIPDDVVEAHLSGVSAAVAVGWKLLAEGKGALAAVEAAVMVMEDDETFDAGRGSFLTSDGRVQLDALMMDGKTLRAGGVGCVEHVRNPIRLAHKVLTESPHVYLVAEGAERFATEHGIELCENSELIIPREVDRLRRFKAAGKPDATFAGAAAEVSGAGSHDTVGAVALDASGNLAAATSTGGTLNKTPGRVGDSSLIGCGCYADNVKAAVSCTGWGEPIMKLVLGKWACDRVEEGEAPHTVARRAITYLKERVNGHGGMILLDQKGRIGAFHNTPRMAWGVRDAKREHAQVEGQFKDF